MDDTFDSGLQEAPEPPKQIGRYEIKRVLGLGAMGQVLLAWDPKLGREVAIKIMAASQRDNPRTKERFVREAQAIAALNHPNIVQIYDTSDPAADELFLVIEKLDGQDLYETMGQNGIVPESVVVAIGHELCLALEAAHAAGIVHRDLKPENVFLTPNGRVVLTDFGIVKAVEDDSAVPGFRERTEIIGTPGFMAPEQLRGQELTRSIDIFALGALLYNVATLHMPHAGASPVAIYQAALEGRITDAKRYNPMLSDAFCAVINRCLAPQASKRPQSVAEVRLALRGILDQLGGSDVRDELDQYVQGPAAFAQKSRRRNIDYTVAALVLAEQGGDEKNVALLRERLCVLDPFHERLVQAPRREPPVSAIAAAEHRSGWIDAVPTPRQNPSRKSLFVKVSAWSMAAIALAFVASAHPWNSVLARYTQHGHSTAAQHAIRPLHPMPAIDVRPVRLDVKAALAAQDTAAEALEAVSDDSSGVPPARVELMSESQGITLAVDRAAEAQPMPQALKLLPGRHTLVFRAPGFPVLRRRITVEPGEHIKLVADLVHHALMVP